MSLSKIPIVLALCILAGCGKNEPGTTLAQGANLPGLVLASNAPIFEVTGKPYTEIVLIDGTWKIHDEAKWQADGRSEDEIHEALQLRFKAHQSSGNEPKILISAAGNTAFKEITKAVRGAARSGFPRVDFLVSNGLTSRVNHAFHLDLPLAGGLVRDREIEPFMFYLDAKGVVFTGSGPGRATMDTDPTDRALPKLNSLLEMYAAAVKAAASPPICQMYANPAVAYQRVIDLFSIFHKHGIITIQFTDLNAHIETTCGEMRDLKRRREDLKIKPRSPAPSSQPRPIGK